MKLRTIPFIGGASYSSKVLGIETANLIAYWPMNEAAGGVADNLEGTAARDGAYTGVTLGQPGIGDGNTCPLFDGANDVCNIYSASLNAAFSGAEGTLALWVKVSGAGVWTDGVARVCMRVKADAGSAITTQRITTNNTWRHTYKGQIGELAGVSETGWFHSAVTWSISAGVDGEVKYYWNGAQVSATDTAIGVWAGALSATDVVIGAFNSGAVSPWSGYLAHAAIWTTPLTLAQILDLATV